MAHRGSAWLWAAAFTIGCGGGGRSGNGASTGQGGTPGASAGSSGAAAGTGTSAGAGAGSSGAAPGTGTSAGTSGGGSAGTSAGAAAGTATGGSAGAASGATSGSASAGSGASRDAGVEAGGDAGASSSGTVPVGHCGALRGRYFPATSWIYTDVSSAPVRGNSGLTTAWLAAHGGWGAPAGNFQIDTSFYINDVDATTPTYKVSPSDPIGYSADCDPNVAFPVPAGGSIEGYAGLVCPGRATGNPNDDCHMLSADFATHTLFEGYQVTLTGGTFYSDCNIAWDMTHDSWGAAPAAGTALPPRTTLNWGIGRGCTGPDAAGFPIAPLLFTVGDVLSGRVEHVIRFALPNDRIQSAPTPDASATRGEHPVFVWPATHAGGPLAADPNAPIYGGRWRLRAAFDPASRGLDPTNAVVKAVVYGLQHYGMALADGGNIPLMAEDGSACSTTWDTLWGNAGSHVLGGIRPTDFDVIETGETDSGYNCVRNPSR